MALTQIYENLPPYLKKWLKKIILPLFKWGIVKPLESWHIFNIKEKRKRKPFLLVDISILHKVNSGTGIQRVVQQVLENLKTLNLTHQVRPCYFKWLWSNGLYDCQTHQAIHIQQGDIFLGLDLSTMQVYRNHLWLKKIRQMNVPLYFVFYDIFPLTHAHYVDNGIVDSFQKWFFKTLPIIDGIISISQTTENEIKNYLKNLNPSQYNPNTQFNFIHLGADFQKNKKNNNLNNSFKNQPNFIPQFLAVSTVEPRKRYDLILNAFNLLWKKNLNIHLHIVGKPGWKNKEIIHQIETHPLLNQKLFWHKTHISDAALQQRYLECDAAIFASDAEGFGLAIVEAAFYHKPLILRDIPVFHEVSQEQAFFFQGTSYADFASDLEKWLSLYEQGKIQSPSLQIYTWQDCAIEIAQILNVLPHNQAEHS